MAGAAVASTSVHPHETNCEVDDCTQPGPPPPVLSSGIVFRHSGWWHDRARVATALGEVFPTGPRIDRFLWCGQDAFVEVSATDPPEYRIASVRCRDRWCRVCGTERARHIAANLVDHLAGRTVRFLTLTIKTDELTLAQAVNKLYRSFAKLRLTRLWKRRVVGGAATCEIKRTSNGSRWHPHLHILVEGKYIPQDDLRRAWFKITGDSYILHIMPVPDHTQAAGYLTKYLSKPVPAQIVRNVDWLQEAIVALNGRRMVTTFGSWRGLKLTDVPDRGAWTRLCSFRELTERAARGDPRYRRILRHLLGQHSLDPASLEAHLGELNQPTIFDLPPPPPPPSPHLFPLY